MSFAEDAQHASELAIEHFRESFLLCFEAMTDGLAAQFKKQARDVIKFFETETTPAIWARLTQIPDPETMQPDPATGIVDPTKVRSIAQSWQQQWEQMAMALGKPVTAAGSY